MTTRRGRITFLLCLLSLSVGLTASAQTADQPQTTQQPDRLFQAFAEDAAIIPGQWWEGQVIVIDGDPVNAAILGLVVAFRPYQNFEVGGSVGFGNTDAPPLFPDGSGATDLDVWGKWNFGRVGGAKNTDFAVGGIATIPTGDDTAGLGEDAFHVALFGSLRHQMDDAVIAAHAGLRINGNGNIFGVPLSGKTSGIAGVGVILPVRDRLSLVGEANLETERFDGGDDDIRVLGGVNWRPLARGTIRAAFSVGLTDGAPDAAIVAGYAVAF